MVWKEPFFKRVPSKNKKSIQRKKELYKKIGAYYTGRQNSQL